MTDRTWEVDDIYLSPHLDDVVLSCGGRIASQARAGRRVLVATITAGDADPAAVKGAAAVAHEFWGLYECAVEHRRREDAAACSVLRARHLHWPVTDCIYVLHPRTGRSLYPHGRDVFGDAHPLDDRRFRVEQLMRALPLAHRIFLPLAIGDHVDHRLTRKTAERVWCGELLYFEDYPYVEAGLSERYTEGEPREWTSEVFPVPEDALRTKIRAVAEYATQLPSLFGTKPRMEERIRAHARATGGERYWRRGSFRDDAR